MQTDGQTHRHNEAVVVLRNFANAPKNQIHMAHLTQSQYIIQNTELVKDVYQKLEDLGADVSIICDM